MNPKNTDMLVMQKVNTLLDSGFTDKDEIVVKVSDEYDLARPIVRRIMNDMVSEFQRKSRVLNKQYEKDAKKWNVLIVME